MIVAQVISRNAEQVQAFAWQIGARLAVVARRDGSLWEPLYAVRIEASDVTQSTRCELPACFVLNQETIDALNAVATQDEGNE